MAPRRVGKRATYRQPAGEAPSPRAGIARASIFDDPLVRRLSLVLALVIIAFLSTVAAALYLGILGSDIPKTSLQRDLQLYDAKIDAGSVDAAEWGSYVSALIEAGQLRKAQQVVDQGLDRVDNRPGAEMTLGQARIHYARKDYEAAIQVCSEGIAALEAYHEEQKNIDGSPEQKNAPISPNYWELVYIRGLSHLKLGEHREAIDDFGTYLEEVPNAADVLVLRGDARRESGDSAGAEDDYRRALRFVSDQPGAIEGLEKLGVE